MRAYYEFCAADAVDKLLVSFPLNKDSVVLDVGGYYGDFAAQIYCRYGCKVFVFEPVKEFYEKIRDRFRNNQDIEAINAGVGASNKLLRINKSSDGSSVFGQNREMEEIRMISLLEYMDDHIPTKVDLIAINIEGGEYELLDAMFSDHGNANQFNYVLIQFHDFVANAPKMRDELREHMLRTHDLIWDFPFVWECWKRRDSL
jgi:FkbM family methyltransferase